MAAEAPAGGGAGAAAQAELSLVEHLAELRQRLVRSLLAVAVGTGAAYAVIDPLFTVFSRPLLDVLPAGSALIFTSYPEAFFTYLKLAFTVGVFLASPFVLYQAWAFVAPGLYAHERRLALPFVVFGTLFFVGGGAFGYFAAFPAAFRFLAGYASDGLELLPSLGEYFSLVVRLLLAFGAAFELPLVMVLLALAGVVDARMLHRGRKYAVLLIFVAAAVLTPTPDVVNQCVLAGPLWLLYELSVGLVWLVGRRRRRA
ncbi:twin-arginine translocase subunit TatC [Dissulfurirhabdus thermomarina]|uniref:Sec-independent protein translocase protein TatC n=1 Tax=Dissulfurirhabdus thermomarina TaxID=1765737 RepID=A0A6N9TUC7_DISTH|nr:twin-arginine translocase subunit TatC [Dissulfurirhabdus thermomarina]NDY42106.1 twin-arginine translocase subunit TatC [Dissulfurirhabdus thermomarina]NMX22482.1 twin-arginine translocase subunit TatC [Dissulfurirhabdus thermomarina]